MRMIEAHHGARLSRADRFGSCVNLWRFVCACGAQGPPRMTTAEARDDHWYHIAPCPACGGHGTPQTRPDSFGNWDPCDACEGTGLIDFERDRPRAA